MDLKKISSEIKSEANRIGFNLCGISKAQKNDHPDRLIDWIDNGYDASMSWIKKREEERNNVFKYFPKVKSIISFGYNYYTGENDLETKEYKISNYAWGEDYHTIIKKKLYHLIKFIKKNNADFEYRVCVDTSPVSEKYWAQKSGIGWIGKHTNVINKQLGSWFFLAEILLDLELDYDSPFIEDLCGTCTKCIDECPTNAIINEYKLDSNKCISYLTIEHRDDIPEEFSGKLDNWIYGCDICQQVCPWNEKFHKYTNDENFRIRSEVQSMSKTDWNKLTEEKYKKLFKNSAIKRTKFKGLSRNVNANRNNN